MTNSEGNELSTKHHNNLLTTKYNNFCNLKKLQHKIYNVNKTNLHCTEILRKVE